MKMYRYNQEIQKNKQENENDIKKEIKRNQKESSGTEDRQRKNNKSMIRVTGEKKKKHTQWTRDNIQHSDLRKLSRNIK